MGLTVKQQVAKDEIDRGNNIFITGPGGVGKSYLINYIMDQYSKDTVLLSPTGIAALNIGGATIHRTFKFGLSYLHKNKRGNVDQKARDLFGKDSGVNRIVIDEISMVRADLFAAIDKNLRLIRRQNIPFGGLQVVLVGDFFQLEPVVTNKDIHFLLEEFDNPFAFSTDSWREGDFRVIELDEIIRQSDQETITNLNIVRKKEGGFKQAIEFFNIKGFTNEVVDPTILTTTNKNTEVINRDRYDELGGKEYIYHGTVKGQIDTYPVDRVLKLRVGAKVLICANHPEGKYVNGTQGYVESLTDNAVIVKTLQGQTVVIEPFTWTSFEYVKGEDGSVNTKPVGEYRQLPIKYGWAITIHKSQGMTIQNLALYLGSGCFSSGQLYVALSRMKDINKFMLLDEITSKDLIVSPQVQDFYKQHAISDLSKLL